MRRGGGSPPSLRLGYLFTRQFSIAGTKTSGFWAWLEHEVSRVVGPVNRLVHIDMLFQRKRRIQYHFHASLTVLFNRGLNTARPFHCLGQDVITPLLLHARKQRSEEHTSELQSLKRI